MRLSLSYRKQGVDLTKRQDIIRETADIFDDASDEGANHSIYTFKFPIFLGVDLRADIHAVMCSRLVL